jgi:hypothetical protein
MKGGQGRSVRQAIFVSAVIAGAFELASAATPVVATSPEHRHNSVVAPAVKRITASINGVCTLTLTRQRLREVLPSAHVAERETQLDA